MSRVGKLPIKILQGVKVNVQGQDVRVEGPKGKLQHNLPSGVVLKVEGESLTVAPEENGPKSARALWGTTRTVLHNMVHGVHTGFTRKLEIVGVGYRASVKGSILNLNLGFSHPVDFKLPEGISAKVEKNTHIEISGADKVLVGLTAAKIRSLREPEPYQGKGVRYSDERIIRKQGKAAGAK